MNRKKLIALGSALALLVTLLAGCGGSSASAAGTADASSAASATAGADSDVIYGQIQSISGNTLTLLLGEADQAQMQGGSMPSGGGSAPTGSGSAPSGSAPTGGGSAPSGSAPSGSAPAGNGSAPAGSADGSTPPAMPSGSGAADFGANGEAADKGMGGSLPYTFTAGEETLTLTVPDGLAVTLANGASGTVSDLAANDVLAVTLSSDGVTASALTVLNVLSGDGQAMGGAPGGTGTSAAADNGTAANTISTDTSVTGTAYTSTGDDENALRVDGATVTLDGVTVEKTAGATSSTENGDFYGSNAGLLALNGAQVTIKNATVTTSAQNGNGVFSYGEGTVVNISDSVIRTSADNSGGIQTTGGGTTNAENLDVETQGNSSAAIRSDRGGGTVNVTGGTYVTNGTGSPAVYCTADITVADAALTANSSEAVVVEGANSVALTDCDVTGSMTGTYSDGSENLHGVMIYQSMSGDAAVGQASFSMTGGTLTTTAGDLFYVTNTNCTILLSGVKLGLANGTLLTVAGNDASRGWGTAGSNGGTVVLTADGQVLTGVITVDDISSLTLTLENGTAYTGCINPDGQAGTAAVTLDGTSTWTLTGDCWLTSFEGSTANIVSNGYTVYVNGTAIN